jgi:hypothetical protein
MRILKLLVLGIGVFSVAFAAYVSLPKKYKYQVSDWYARIGSPPFIDAPDLMEAGDQDELIRSMGARGFELVCTGGLHREEKISALDDHECHSFIKSAYDNIPANLVSFFFAQKKLTHVRVEFPDTSFNQINHFLSRKLANYPRLDQMPNHQINPDNYGKPVRAWVVKEGIVTMSGEGTPNRNVVLLWSAHDPAALSALRR